MKFKLIPQRVIEFNIFEKGKKEIWIWVTWGIYDWHTFTTNDFKVFENCKTIKEIQSIVDEKIKTIKPVTKDKKFKINTDFGGTNWDNLYSIENLKIALGIDDSEAFTNTSSRGGANTEIWQYKNVSEKEKGEILTFGDEEMTLDEAAEQWRDEILTENGWDNGIDTYYEAPLKVVAELVIEKNMAKEEALKIIQKNRHALEFADVSFKKDRKFILEANKQYGGALEYADDSLKKDKEFILTAVKQNDFALQYADDSLKKDRKFILKAVKQSGYALKYADNSLKKDKKIVLAAVKGGGDALEHAHDSFKKDKKIVLQAVKQYGGALQYADDSLKKDKKIVLEAVKQDGYALQDADDSLKKDKKIVLAALKQDGRILDDADDSLKKDKKIVLEAVKQNGYALKYADDGFKKDKEIVLEAVKQWSKALQFADDSLKNDPDILAIVNKDK